MDGPQVAENENIASSSKKKRKRNSEREKKRQRERNRKRMRKMTANSEERTDKPTKILRKSSFISFPTNRDVEGRVHLLKGLFSIEELSRLSDLIEKESDSWVLRKDPGRIPSGQPDSRGYFTAGLRCAVGHFRPGVDLLHWASPVGDIDQYKNQELISVIRGISSIAEGALHRYRPELCPILPTSVWGPFNVFFGLRGVVKPHIDKNDAISFVFPIRMEKSSNGGLRIGSTSYCCNSVPGDAVLMDTDVIQHGVEDYKGEASDRIIGTFVIQKDYLRIQGLKIDKKDSLNPIKISE